jgi:hypothetical protein
MRRLSIILAACTSALILSPTGTAFAQETVELPPPGITPDSPLYFWDELAEEISLRFTLRAEVRAEKAMHYAEERLAEMNCMMAKNNIQATIRAMNGYTHWIDIATENIGTSGNQGANTQAMLALGIAKHTAILDDIADEIPEEARKVMTQTRERACICQQMALGLMEQEDPELANQVRLMLMERQRNSMRLMDGNEAITNTQEESPDTTLPNEQGTGETKTQIQNSGQEQPTGGGQGAGQGESGDGSGPNLENNWGSGADGQGAGGNPTGKGEGPNLQNHSSQTKK